MNANLHIKPLFIIIVACCISSASFAQKAELKHSYTFDDGSAKDDIGNADGLLKGGKIEAGKYIISEEGQYIELPAKLIKINTYTSLSLEAYIIAGKANATNTMLSFFGNKTKRMGTDFIFLSAKNAGYGLSSISGKNYSTPWTTSTDARCNALDDGLPHHIVTTFDNKVLKLYADGLLVDSTTNEDFPDNLLGNIGEQVAYLAKSGYRSDPTWLGVIDAFNIYEGILDAETIEKSAVEYVPGQVLAVRSKLTNPVSSEKFVASESLFNDDGIITLGSRDGWRFHPGDDMNWANPDFDDSDWMFFKPSGLTDPIPDSLWQGYGWFRYRFAADSSVYAMATHLYFFTYGAAEVYLDGILAGKFGIFSSEIHGEKPYMPAYKTYPSILLQHAESHVLAVRYSYHKGERYKKLLGENARTFGFNVGLATDQWNKQIIPNKNTTQSFVYILGTMLLMIFFLHVFMYVLFPTERSNLYIATVAFLLFLHITASYIYVFFELDVLQSVLFRDIPFVILFLAALSMFPITISSIFNQRIRLIHKVLIWLFPVFALANFIHIGFGEPSLIIIVVFILVIIFFTSKALIQALSTKQKGVWIVAVAFLGLVIVTITWIFYYTYYKIFRIEIQAILMYLIYGSIPLGLTAFMASRFRDLYTNLEQKVKERTRELNQSLENLRSTQSQLIQSEKLASLGALTAGIAHEIQNPLNFVNNFSEVSNELMDEMREELVEGSRQYAAGSWQSGEEKLKLANEIAEDIKQNLEKINHHGKRADAIVKGMLQHSRSNSGHKEPTDINALADEYLRLSYHGMRAKDKSFNAIMKTDFDETIGKINVIPQDIGRVILNLITNAFYAVDEKMKLQSDGYEPTVFVSTKKNTDKIVISVKDNGFGIPLEIMDKIFQPFFTTKPTGQGTGLGLSLAYDIVKAHSGEIKVVTKEGQGTEFIIDLQT